MRTRKHFQRRAGYNLMELLTYMAVFAVVMGVVFPAFHKVFKQFRSMERNTDDIVRVMRAGERWREDVRAANTTPTVTGHRFSAGNVTYEFADNAVWRTAPDGARWAVLTDVKSTTVHEEKRPKVTAWRWEVELLTKQDVVRVKPLFSFMAVAGANGGTTK